MLHFICSKLRFLHRYHMNKSSFTLLYVVKFGPSRNTREWVSFLAFPWISKKIIPHGNGLIFPPISLTKSLRILNITFKIFERIG